MVVSLKISNYENLIFCTAFRISTATIATEKSALVLWHQRNHSAAEAHLYPLLSVDLHTIGT